jgi:hypothetical protein
MPEASACLRQEQQAAKVQRGGVGLDGSRGRGVVHAESQSGGTRCGAGAKDMGAKHIAGQREHSCEGEGKKNVERLILLTNQTNKCQDKRAHVW